MFPDLYLMRHGQTQWNAEGRLQGRLDSPLTALGRAQARRQAELVRTVAGGRYSSPQGRAVTTARLVFGAAEFRCDSRLAEIDVGAFSGQLLSEIRPRHPQIFARTGLGWYDLAPGGETLEKLRERARSFLGELDAPALIVTHGITLRMLALVALGWPISRLGDLTVRQGAVHALRKGAYEVWC